MSYRLTSIAVLAALAFAGAVVPAHSETLLMQRVKQEHGVPMPTRGMTMAQVEGRFGPPSSKLPPAGGDAPRHPVINRWKYAKFTVYFERNLVIDSVMNRASPTEIGPKGSLSDR